MALFSLVRFVARGENTLYGGFSLKVHLFLKNNKTVFLTWMLQATNQNKYFLCIQKICQLRDGTMPNKTFVRSFHNFNRIIFEDI